MTKINSPKFDMPNTQLRPKHIPKEYMELAEGMETQFANQLLTEMRKTVPTSSPKSPSSKIYESWQDLERAKIIAQSNHGLGVKQLILEQIYPAHQRQQAPINDRLETEQVSSNLGERNE